MFRPSIHGWPFRNAYASTGPELGIGGPAPPGLGLAGGFCWTALDRYLRGVAIPRDVWAPEPGEPLHVELLHRQVAALAGAWGRVREWQAEADGSWRDRLPIPLPLGGTDLASRSRSEWRGIRKRIAAGQPVLLTLLPEADRYQRARAVKQVLATGWSRQGSRGAFSIYDPDHPEEDDRRLTFGLRGPLDARLTGGERVRGFFPVPYDRNPPATLRTEPFDDRRVIGLNRSVRGRVSPAVGRKHLDLVARDDRGALIHFRRARGRPWDGTNVTEAEGFGASELHADPVALHGGGALHAFSRTYVGDLLHFRLGRSWSVTDCTDQKGAGPRFRLAGRPVPVAGPWRQLTVIGRDAEGGLVHYHSAAFRGWKAEQVPGDAMATDPEVARSDDALHVVATAPDGRVLHWVRQEDWSITDPDTGDGPAVRLAGRPAVVVRGGTVQVLGRDRSDQLAILTLLDGGEWQRVLLAEGLAGDPEATRGPSGLHIFAPTTAGVAHVRETPDGWEWEDVVASRAALPVTETGAGQVTCWGTETELRVFVRRGSVLRALTWTPDSDWTAELLTERAGAPSILFEDRDGRAHLVLTDGHGTVIHVETGAWREAGPDDGAEADLTAVVPAPREEEDAGAVVAPEPVEAAAPEPEPSEPVAAQPEEDELMEIQPEELDLMEPEEPEPEEDELESLAAAEEEVEVVYLEVERFGEDDVEEGAESTEPATDPAERAGGQPVTESVPAEEPGPTEIEEEPGPTEIEEEPGPAEPEEEPEAPPGPQEVEEPEEEPLPPAATAEPEEEEVEAERPAAAEAEPEPEAEVVASAAGPPAEPGSGSPDEEPEAEDEKPPGMPEDMEPMDLSLLDTWPPSHKRRRRSRRKRKSNPEEEDEKDEGS